VNIALGSIVFAWEQIMRIVEMLFHQSRIHQLGHVISGEGIDVDPTKVEAIREWPASTNVPDVHNFMGLADIINGSIEGFSKIAIRLRNCRRRKRSLCGPRNVQKHFEGSRSC
jgi:hypothetical protein